MKYLWMLMLMGSLVSCTSEQEHSSTEVAEPTSTAVVAAPQKMTNDLSKKNLKGAIKSRKVEVYAAVIKDGYVTNGAPKGAVEVSYNKAGNQTKLLTYNEEGAVANTWTYTYNEGGLLEESNFSDGNITRRLSYDYNKKNQRTICREYVNDKEVKTTTYGFDDKGREQTINDSFVGSKGRNKSVHGYDGKGNKVMTKIYNEQEELQLEQFFTYNEAGQEIQQAIFTGNHLPSYKRKFEYDKQGNKIKDTAFDGEGIADPSDSYKYEYEYDEKGNWTVQIRYNYNDVADEFVEQKITYYE